MFEQINGKLNDTIMMLIRMFSTGASLRHLTQVENAAYYLGMVPFVSANSWLHRWSESQKKENMLESRNFLKKNLSPGCLGLETFL